MLLLNKWLFFLGLALVAAGLFLTVTLAGIGAQAQAEAPPTFDDVPANAWYRSSVETLAKEGIFEGTECEEGFCPGQALLRREMAIWLVRALEVGEELSDYDSRFVDVEDNDWQTPYIERLADLGITHGCKSETPHFCPDRPVSRGQMASFLTRALNLPAAPSANFSDIDYETNVHAKNIDRLAASRITVGCIREPLKYCPSRSVTRAQMATFIDRALEWRKERAAQAVVQDENPGLFLTEENELSRFVRQEVVEKYATDNPWMMEVWNYTNREDFEYVRSDLGAWTYYAYNFDSEEGLGKFDAVRIEASCLPEDSYCTESLILELAHVYTMANGVATRPGPLAMASLYFERLSGDQCVGWGLYADVAPVLVLPSSYIPEQAYWRECSHLPSTPTPGAVDVVRSAFSGDMPQWFYDAFQLPDGSLDYQAIWAEVKEIDYLSVRVAIAYQLKDEFGGYCSEQELIASILPNGPELIQPWRDGGC